MNRLQYLNNGLNKLTYVSIEAFSLLRSKNAQVLDFDDILYTPAKQFYFISKQLHQLIRLKKVKKDDSFIVSNEGYV